MPSNGTRHRTVVAATSSEWSGRKERDDGFVQYRLDNSIFVRTRRCGNRCPRIPYTSCLIERENACNEEVNGESGML